MKRSLMITNSLLRMRRSPACVLQRTVEEPSTRQGLFSQFQSISSKQVSNINLFFKNKLLFSLLGIRILNIYKDITHSWLSQTFFTGANDSLTWRCHLQKLRFYILAFCRFGKCPEQKFQAIAGYICFSSCFHHVYCWKVWIGFKLNMLSWVLL